MEKIRDVLADEISGPDQPVIVIAGHIHVDHIYLGITDRKFRSMARIIYAAEDWGALQIETGNDFWTGSDVVEVLMPPVRVDLHLLTAEDKKTGIQRSVYLPGLEEIILTPMVHMVDGSPFFGQYMPLYGDDRIEFWHTPGHSFDSLTIRIGDLIHIGDIPFSANPGIAGRPGWDRSSLLHSIASIRHLVLERSAGTCCPGHGRTLTRKDTLALLDRIELDIVSLPQIGIFDKNLLDLSLWHGLDLIEETKRIFTVIAGRMMFLSYELEEFGLTHEAGVISSLFEDESIDKLLCEFMVLYEEYKLGKRVKLEVLNKILQVLERVSDSFPADQMAGIIDISLIRRATRIFSDLLGTIHGSIPCGNQKEVLLLSLIQTFIDSRTSSGVTDCDLMAAAEDEEVYRQALVSRLAHHPHAVRLLFQPDILDTLDSTLMVFIDPVRFMDFLSALSDYFEGISADKLTLKGLDLGEEVVIIFSPDGTSIMYDIPVPGATQREIRYAGGKVVSVMQPDQEDIRISIPKRSL
jgi:glyoxylase-like metal-dependent hydrolase (beta-lactamase superfamily II)